MNKLIIFFITSLIILGVLYKSVWYKRENFQKNCGPGHGYKSCGGSNCCSKYGWCSGTKGTKSDWCHQYKALSLCRNSRW